MAEQGANRVLIGLPDRLAKAKDQIAVFEHRQRLIREVINEPADANRKLATINQICLGKYDPR